ncbi:hypothetical protein HPB50_015135 [Hyalomma asiaticum]|uniref:Uncharacterized protein n=1 Tax=Hyalomma asiaticum TaxID=266040 RepID=A0ACB7RWT4_HYAAI|nr:hypothetical protein HPB50_015135 [Hyalomma asiaticum]
MAADCSCQPGRTSSILPRAPQRLLLAVRVPSTPLNLHDDFSSDTTRHTMPCHELQPSYSTSSAAEVQAAPNQLPDLPDAPVLKAHNYTTPTTLAHERHYDSHMSDVTANQCESTTRDARRLPLAEPSAESTGSPLPQACNTSDTPYPVPAFVPLAIASG